jgi:cytochrome c biogenesis protein
MRTALILLLLLAAAAIPGSVYPQRSADPNGVTSYFSQNPELAKVLDGLQLFDVYSSVWFSSIYILLFVSLIGCVVPRSIVHAKAMASEPPATPRVLARMPAYQLVDAKKSVRSEVVENAAKLLKRERYRVIVDGDSVSAERGYLRETGNLIFHVSLIGVLVSVGFGGAYSYSGQRLLVEGDTFVNNLAGYDSFSPGAFFNEGNLPPFSMTLNKFEIAFDNNVNHKANAGTPIDFRATVSTKNAPTAAAKPALIRVNEPLEMPDAKVYLTGNGYAPVLAFSDQPCKNLDGGVRVIEGPFSYQGAVPYLPQDSNYTSLGVIKLPDAKPNQYGVLSFFYPTAGKLPTGALTSVYPAALSPQSSLLTLNVYVGDLGLDSGIPSNVFSLATHGLKQLSGGKTGVKPIQLLVKGNAENLPNNMGCVAFTDLKRFASLDISYNPGQGWVLLFALLSLAGLVLSLLVPRRRVWVKRVDDGFEVAALARGDDPALNRIVQEIATELSSKKKKKDKDD